MIRVGLLTLSVWIVGAQGVAAASAPWASLTLPGTPAVWAELAGWRASRLERVRLLRDLIVFFHCTPSHGRVEDLDALDAAAAIFDTVDRRLTALGGDHTIRLDRSRRSTRREVRDLLDALGYELTERDGRVVVQARDGADDKARRDLLRRAGLPLDDFIQRLQRDASAVLIWPTFTVPLPLGAEFWHQTVGRTPTSSSRLAMALIRDRRWALLYVGLLGLDGSTLETLAREPRVVANFADADRAAPFANFSRSLHIANGTIRTPGGAAQVALWQELIGAKVTDPVAFIDHVLRADNGCLAWFFDFVQQAPPHVQAFALSTWEADEDTRRDRVRAFYNTFGAAMEVERFNLHERVFARPIFDPAIIASLLPIDRDGRLLGPSSRKFWREVFRSWDLSVAIKSAPHAASSDDVMDAASTVEILREDGGVDPWPLRHPRVAAMMIAQAFARREPRGSASSIAVIARASLQFPALMCTLDRLAVGLDTSVSVIKQANLLSTLDQEEFHLGLGQFQAAVALVERGALASSLTPPQIDALLRSIAAFPFQSGRRARGGLVRWMAESLLPMAKVDADLAGLDGASTPERQVLAFLAGRVKGRDAPTFEWEGWKYAADPSTARFKDAERIRSRQSAITIDQALDMLARVDTMAAIDGQAPARQLATALRTTATRLSHIQPDPVFRDRFSIAEALEDAAKNLDSVRARQDARHVARARQQLLAALDWIALEVGRSLVYVSYLGAPDSPVLPSNAQIQSHDFGTAHAVRHLRTSTAWALPDIRSGKGIPWHVEGSLLAMDHGLANLMLRESVDAAPNEGMIDLADRQGLVRTAVAVHTTHLWSSATSAAIQQRLRDGRRIIAAGSPAPDGPWEWRFSAVAWAALNEPDAVASLFSLADLLDLVPRPDVALDELGPSLEALTGSLRTGVPPRLLREALAGHLGRGYHAASTMDLKLRIAELMAERDIPVVLAPNLMIKATTQILAQTSLGAPFDWIVVLRRITDYSAKDLADLVVSLTSDGTLVAIEP